MDCLGVQNRIPLLGCSLGINLEGGADGESFSERGAMRRLFVLPVVGLLGGTAEEKATAESGSCRWARASWLRSWDAAVDMTSLYKVRCDKGAD